MMLLKTLHFALLLAVSTLGADNLRGAVDDNVELGGSSSEVSQGHRKLIDHESKAYVRYFRTCSLWGCSSWSLVSDGYCVDTIVVGGGFPQTLLGGWMQTNKFVKQGGTNPTSDQACPDRDDDVVHGCSYQSHTVGVYGIWGCL